MLRKQLLDSSRGRIVALLQRGASTVEDIAAELGLTRNAVRSQLIAMERDGLVRQIGTRAGTTRPSHLFELTAEVEQLLSRAYIPVLTQLVATVSEDVPGDQLERMLRKVGASLAHQLTTGRLIEGPIEARAAFASRLLNEELGALTTVERNGHLLIRGAGCPLAALTGKYRDVCLAVESLVAEIVGAPVHECCERDGRPRCCFEITERRADAHQDSQQFD